MVCSTWDTHFPWPSAISTPGIKDSMGTMYCSPSVSIVQVCLFVLQPSNWIMSCKNTEILQNSQKIFSQSNSSTTCWEWWTFHKKISKNSKIQDIGLDTSHLWVASIWIGLVYMLTTQDHSSPQTWTRTTIHLSNGNSSNWKKRDILTSVKGHRFSHQKISKCVLITTDQRVKVLDLKNLLWSKLKSWN